MPSANDYWWFGHNLYKDYYVIHNMSQKTLGFVPTLDRLKDEIMDGAKPVKAFPSYNWVMMLVKLGVGAVWSVGIWLMIMYLFEPTSFTGFNFLNQAGYDPTKRKMVTSSKATKVDAETI